MILALEINLTSGYMMGYPIVSINISGGNLSKSSEATIIQPIIWNKSEKYLYLNIY
jgi:hypothetical protein